MGGSVRYQRKPGWVSRRVDGAVLVMGPDAEASRLTGAAAAIWPALDHPSSADEVVTWAGGEPDADHDHHHDARVALARDALDLLVGLDMVIVVDDSAP